MARTLRLAPRQQYFLDLVRQVPEADIASVETYLYFLRIAGDILAQQQAFFGRYDLSEGKEAAGVTRGTMTGLLAGLERSGLVKRTQHPEDGRMFRIELTERVFDLLERLLPERVNRIVAFMSGLTREEQHHLRDLLEKMERNVPALCAS
jgi:DNA-binding MarR family transcriptional regulator